MTCPLKQSQAKQGLALLNLTPKHLSPAGNENSSTLRSLFYPPVRSDRVKEGQLCCGEHDYDSITLNQEGVLQVNKTPLNPLVFQNQEGDLQNDNSIGGTRSGEFISAPSIPGTVLINIADLMQRWTSDVFLSVVHRVLLPPAGDWSTLQSLAFFVQPDEALINTAPGDREHIN
ncbi:LOW QUALITY PROTEIN: uncharacterized protein ACWYII_041078 [Salvelinus alpinus]